MIKVIIFDQDETLIHPKHGLYEEYVIKRAEDFAKTFGITDIELAKKLAFKTKQEKCQDSTIALYDFMKIPRKIWYDKMNIIEVKKYLQKDERLTKFIKSLKQKKVLLTNSPTLQTKKIFDAVGLDMTDFDLVFTWEENKEPPKPREDIFKQIFKRFNVKPHECMMVGNEIKVDLKMPHELGMITVGINLESPADKNVDFEIKDLEELPLLIIKINKDMEKVINKEDFGSLR